jgi:hypothetical protein
MADRVLLSFDAEEFDIPQEFGRPVPEATQMSVSAHGLEAVLALLDRLDTRATFFTTARFALANEALVRRVAARHEVASHGYDHSTFCDEDLLRSRQALEAITSAPCRGFRRARMAPTDHGAIRAAGYSYNSSENPIYLPGRYNNFRRPRRPYFSGDLLNIPVSATPLVRFPLFWLSFKNVPLLVSQAAATATLAADSAINLYFHPWEFADIGGFGLPGYITRCSGDRLAAKLERYLSWLKRRASFITFSEFDHSIRDARSAASAAPAPASVNHTG